MLRLYHQNTLQLQFAISNTFTVLFNPSSSLKLVHYMPPMAVFLCALIAFMLPWLYQRFFSRHGLPTEIPWADGCTSAMSIIRLHIRSLFSLKRSIETGYHTASARIQPLEDKANDHSIQKPKRPSFCQM
jgi:hypothetical protein